MSLETEPVTAQRAAALEAIAELFDPANRHDPYTPVGRLRELGPLHRAPLGPHLVTRFDDCLAILGDTRWSHSGEGAMLHAPEDSAEAAQERALIDNTFVWLDPPDHTRLRGLVVKAFTPRVVTKLRPRVEEICAGLLDRGRSAGEYDLVEGLAYPLPLTVICELLGVPAADHPRVQQWSMHLARGFDPDSIMTPPEREGRKTAARELFLYFRGLLDERHRRPGDDLLSALAAVEEAGDVLSEIELLATCVTMLVAGHETTVNLVGNGMLALLRNPDQYDLLRGDPDVAVSAVDELMRYDPSVQITTRTATCPLTVGGREFSAGEGVFLLINSGNRDPARFADPDRLDLARYRQGPAPRPKHLSFGWGIHYCLGAALAVLQMEVLLRHLAAMPRLELAGEPAYRPNLFFRGLASLPVRFGS